MIELPWWGLLLAALAVYTLGQLSGMALFLRLVRQASTHKDKKLSRRYPEGVN